MAIDAEIMAVESVKTETADIKTITIRTTPDSSVNERKPGQFVTVSLREGSVWSAPHPFTIANAPGNGIIRLTVKHVDQFTGRLHAIQPGEEIAVKGPFGTFCADIDKAESVVCIAGGIGITPFLSVFRHYHKISTGFKKAVLLWGCNSSNDFFSLTEIDAYYFFMDFFAVIASEKPFRYATMKMERLNSLAIEEGLLTAGLLRKYADVLRSNIYVCGSEAMQDYVMEQLKQCQVPKEKIKTEKFG